MIPKILHYVWIPTGFGDTPPTFNIACQQQAIDLHPGWAVQEHSDDSLLSDPSLSPIADLLRKAWDKFEGIGNSRSDMLRLAALYAHGGIYLDYDVWPIKPLDRFLVRDLLLGGNSFQPFVVGEHVIGAEPRSPKILRVLKHFCRCKPNEDGVYSMALAMFCWYHGWEDIQMPDVFCPHPRNAPSEDLYRTTEVTYAIHCWSVAEYDVGSLKALTTKEAAA